MLLPGREWQERYRFGFNGQEIDRNIASNNHLNTATYWQYDSRLGKRWNTDPIVYESISPYAVFNNNPISNADPNGDSDSGTRHLSKRAAKRASEVGGIIDDSRKYTDGVVYVQYGWSITDRDIYGNIIIIDGGIISEKLTLNKYEKRLNKVSQFLSKGDESVRSGKGKEIGMAIGKFFASFDPGVPIYNYGSLKGWWGDGTDVFGDAQTETEAKLGIVFLALDLGGISKLKNASKLAQLKKVSKVHPFQPDWLTKGAHLTVDGIEVALKPGTDGSLIISNIFSSQSAMLKEAASKTEILLSDPKIRESLIHNIDAAIETFSTGSELEKSKCAELKLLKDAITNIK